MSRWTTLISLPFTRSRLQCLADFMACVNVDFWENSFMNSRPRKQSISPQFEQTSPSATNGMISSHMFCHRWGICLTAFWDLCAISCDPRNSLALPILNLSRFKFYYYWVGIFILAFISCTFSAIGTTASAPLSPFLGHIYTFWAIILLTKTFPNLFHTSEIWRHLSRWTAVSGPLSFRWKWHITNSWQKLQYIQLGGSKHNLNLSQKVKGGSSRTDNASTVFRSLRPCPTEKLFPTWS